MLNRTKKIIYSLLIKERKESRLIDFDRLNLIVSNKSQLKDIEFLEHELILSLGLNNEILNEFPTHLYPYCGQGLFIWQYPNQLAKYLKFISEYEINSYLEIGVRHGGMFLLTKTYLETVNNNNVYCVGVDIEKSDILKENAKEFDYEYLVKSSSSPDFKKIIKDEYFDLV
ncbi:MAG: CmcI family methyltransferase, partial [Bacteroidia bacterium]